MLSTKQKIPRKTLVKQLIQDAGHGRLELNAEEKQFFSDEDRAEKVLFHPMLQIVTTMEEIDLIKQVQDLDNKKRHRPGVNSISTKGHIETTYATKGIIERIAEELLNTEPMKLHPKGRRPTLRDEKMVVQKTEIEKRN